jgi:uncharacterized protein YciW
MWNVSVSCQRHVTPHTGTSYSTQVDARDSEAASAKLATKADYVRTVAGSPEHKNAEAIRRILDLVVRHLSENGLLKERHA